MKQLGLVLALLASLQFNCNVRAAVPVLAGDDIAARVQLTKKERQNLEDGKVVVGFAQADTAKYVVGHILLDATPEQIWAVLANPYEFQNGLYARMKEVHMLVNEPRRSVMRCKIVLGMMLPDIIATVESNYVPTQSIEFHRVEGSLKALDGGWKLTRRAGSKTEVAYWMYIDPGTPVPSWVLQAGMKMDLPKTLMAVKKRLDELKTAKAPPMPKTISAAVI